jgi:hypothetical protein
VGVQRSTERRWPQNLMNVANYWFDRCDSKRGAMVRIENGGCAKGALAGRLRIKMSPTRFGMRSKGKVSRRRLVADEF